MRNSVDKCGACVTAIGGRGGSLVWMSNLNGAQAGKQRLCIFAQSTRPEAPCNLRERLMGSGHKGGRRSTVFAILEFVEDADAAAEASGSQYQGRKQGRMPKTKDTRATSRDL